MLCLGFLLTAVQAVFSPKHITFESTIYEGKKVSLGAQRYKRKFLSSRERAPLSMPYQIANIT